MTTLIIIVIINTIPPLVKRRDPLSLLSPQRSFSLHLQSVFADELGGRGRVPLRGVRIYKMSL
jgi:hypothetical protein